MKSTSDRTIRRMIPLSIMSKKLDGKKFMLVMPFEMEKWLTEQSQRTLVSKAAILRDIVEKYRKEKKTWKPSNHEER